MPKIMKNKLTVEQNRLVHNYSKLLIRAWTDRSFLEQLKANPREILKEFEILTPARIEILTETANPRATNLTAQIQAWEKAKTTGVLTIYIAPCKIFPAIYYLSTRGRGESEKQPGKTVES